MSVYTDLLKIGLDDSTASEVADAVRLTRQDLVTKRDLAEFEARLMRTIMTTMISMTGIFAAFVGVMTALIARWFGSQYAEGFFHFVSG